MRSKLLGWWRNRYQHCREHRHVHGDCGRHLYSFWNGDYDADRWPYRNGNPSFYGDLDASGNEHLHACIHCDFNAGGDCDFNVGSDCDLNAGSDCHSNIRSNRHYHPNPDCDADTNGHLELCDNNRGIIHLCRKCY
jgi:hypothetical protein